MITYTGVVLNYDGVPDRSGDIFSTETAIELPSWDVPVTFSFHSDPEFYLGRAKLHFHEGELRYIMSLDETRLPKYALDPLTPAIGGRIISRTDRHMDEVAIFSIGLSERENCDPRIKPIGAQK